MIFDIFFKSKGGKSTLNMPTTYYAKMATIETQNFEELDKKATKIIGNVVGEFEVDLHGRGIDYINANGTGKKK